MFLLSSVLWALVVGCGDDTTVSDGGTDGDSAVVADAMPVMVEPPELPAPVVLTPCPEGWMEVGDDPPLTCEPWAVEDSPTCTGATARFVGAAGCERLGSECPSDGFPAAAPPEALFVSADAATGGDGSRAAPFSTITDALAAAASGDVVAIAVGQYDEALDVPGGVTLLGACTEGTRLSSSGGRIDRGVITVTGSDVVVKDLRIESSEQGGIWVVGMDQSARLEDVLIEDVRVAGIDAENGASIEGSRIVVRRSRPTVFGSFGRGLTLETGSSTVIDHLVVEDCIEFGVLSYGDGTTVELSDAAVLRIGALPDGSAGPGLVATNGGTLTAERTLVENTTDFGVASLAEGALTLRDSLVRETRSRVMGTDRGYGISAQTDAFLDIERTTITTARGVGVFLNQAVGTMRDVVIQDTRTRENDSALGRGLSVQDLAMIDAERVHIRRVRETAVIIGGVLPSFGTLSDVTIADVAPDEITQRFGRGVTVQARSDITFDRTLIERAVESGISNAAHLRMNDLTVREVAPAPNALPPGGFGVTTFAGGETTLRRVFIEDTVTAGILVSGASRVDASEVRIEGVSSVDCTEMVICAPGGHAFAAYFDAEATINHFAFETAEVCGIHVANGGDIIATNGSVTNSGIGACVQSDAQSVDDLQSNVLYYDNGTPLEATMLPVPMVGSGDL